VRTASSETLFTKEHLLHTLIINLPGCTVVPVTTMGSLAMNSDVNSRHGTDSPQPQNADPLQASQAWRPIVWSSRSRRIESGASPRSSLAKRSNVEVLPYATYSCALFPPSLLRQGGFGAHSGQSGIYVANRKESVPDWSSGLLCIQNGTGRRTKKERCARDV
jgi:hypothetical protein